MKMNKVLMLTATILIIFATMKGGFAVLLQSRPVDIGTDIVDFNLLGTDGNYYSPESFSDAQGLVLVVTCNHCPYAKASWPVLIGLQTEFKDRGIQFVAINPNDSNTFPEDSYDKMKEYEKEIGINFPYLRDETQKVAEELQAVCTPDIYVYDQYRKLYYHGRINDNWQHPDKVTEHNLKDALISLLNAEEPPENQPPSMGCSIKWLRQ